MTSDSTNAATAYDPASTTSRGSALGPATDAERRLVRAQAEEPTIGALVAATSAHLSSLVRDEIQLAKKEIKVDVKLGGMAAGMFAGAAFLALMGLIFLLHTAAQGLIALGLPGWAGYGIVTLVLFILAAVLGLIGKSKITKVKGKPERTIATTQETVDKLKATVKG